MDEFRVSAAAAGLPGLHLRMKWAGPTNFRLDVRKIARGKNLTADGMLKTSVGWTGVVVSETYGTVSLESTGFSRSNAVELFEQVAGRGTATVSEWECIELTVHAMCKYKEHYPDPEKIVAELGDIMPNNLEICANRVICTGATDMQTYARQLNLIAPVLNKYRREY